MFDTGALIALERRSPLLAAAERRHAVLTSDDGDIAEVDPELILVHV